MKIPTKSLKLFPLANLSSLEPAGELVAFGIGPDSAVYLAFALKPLDYRKGRGATFSVIRPKTPQTYKVIALTGDQTSFNIVIEREEFNIHHIQPLGDRLLLVCARAGRGGPDRFDRNGRIYSAEGELIDTILLGDGIASVQTTENKVIWTSFFDEGVLGNYGWDDPIGASGLIAWNEVGEQIYSFKPTEDLDDICDCYALNVASDTDTWFYYYTPFELVHLRDRTIKAHWNIPVKGSGAFAIWEGYALCDGGYSDRNAYYLMPINRYQSPEIAVKIELRDPQGDPIIPERIQGRGDALHIIARGFLYRMDVQTALSL